jgi:hypothetical protein
MSALSKIDIHLAIRDHQTRLNYCIDHAGSYADSGDRCMEQNLLGELRGHAEAIANLASLGSKLGWEPTEK